MSIAANFPTIRPTLNLDFVNSRTVDPRITFTRASTATFYDGKTFAKAEENLLVRSQEFDNAAWVKASATVTANTGAAPDGTTTADTLTAGDANGSALQTFTAMAQPYTFSLWVRRTVGTGTVEITADGTTWSAITISGTWTRFSVTVTPSAGSRTAGIRLATNGDAVEIWGAQLEQRSAVTAYTPTTDQPITRYVPQLMTAAANTPRIDFDPVTGACRGLLIEEQRTNLLRWSQEFDNAYWIKSKMAAPATNSAVAPDGTLTAEGMVANTTLAVHYFERNEAGLTAATNYAASVFVRQGSSQSAVLRVSGTGNALHGVILNFSTRVATLTTSSEYTSGAGVTTSWGAQNVGNGWWRIWVAGYPDAAATNRRFRLFLTNASGAETFAGDGTTVGYFVWGAQLEAGAFPTSYIPTTSSQVTRSADSAVMTGTNFSSWYRQDEGTLFAEFFPHSTPITGANPAAVSADNGSPTERFQIRRNSGATGTSCLVVTGNNTQASITSTIAVNQVLRTAFAARANDFAASTNGGNVSTYTSGSMPTVTQLDIGYGSGTAQLNGRIRRIAYWPARLPDAQLQALTA